MLDLEFLVDENGRRVAVRFHPESVSKPVLTGVPRLSAITLVSLVLLLLLKCGHGN